MRGFPGDNPSLLDCNTSWRCLERPFLLLLSWGLIPTPQSSSLVLVHSSSSSLWAGACRATLVRAFHSLLLCSRLLALRLDLKALASIQTSALHLAALSLRELSMPSSA